LSSSDQIEIGKTILKGTKSDATVILEASNPEDARELYDRGANYVIQSVQLSSDRLADYLEALLEDPEAFETAAARDAELLRDPRPFRNIHEGMAGELDD